MKIKNILVIAGTGLIRSHLIEALFELGHYVICLDNLLTGSIISIYDLKKNKNSELLKQDITEPHFRVNIDEIYNLA